MSAASSPPWEKFCQREEGTSPWGKVVSIVMSAGIPAAPLRISITFLTARINKGRLNNSIVLNSLDFFFTKISIQVSTVDC